ncbi:MAG TPA: ATP-binding protein [Capillimicrobium sp.]|nr:ATP-binding protein [Capillimicrobium sp.]
MSDEVLPAASVLLAFSASNVRSFRDDVQLSLLATSVAERQIVRDVPWRARGRHIGVLPVAGIFGANASGKTNVLRAMDDMRSHVLYSFRRGSPTGGVPTHPFRLDPRFLDAPSSFEIDLVLDGVRHLYGFKVDNERILEEWAYHFPRGRATLLFSRDRTGVELGARERSKSRAVLELLRPNALFLSTAASAAHPLLLPLYGWFERNLLLAEADSRRVRQAFTAKMLDDDESRHRVLALLRAADLGVTGARVREMDAALKERLDQAVRILSGADEKSESPEAIVEFDDFEVRLTHKGVQGDVELLPSDESLGTLVWFGLVGPVIDALAGGAVLLADELDASLHPALVREIVRLFQDPETNTRRAQLLFNSHDVTVLGDTAADRLLGRDQVWFTEKDDDGSTRLYPLSDLGVRKDEAVARRYLAGRYGGTPILSHAEFNRAAELATTGEPS